MIVLVEHVQYFFIYKASKLHVVCFRQKLTSMSKHFCENCDSILPISDAEDYFSMLGVKKDFNVSISELQFNFRQHQVTIFLNNTVLFGKLHNLSNILYNV